MNKILKTVCVILALIFIGLIYAIMVETTPKAAPVVIKTPSKAPQSFIFPSATSTEAEKASFSRLIRENAVSTSTITITACKPVPRIVKVTVGQKVLFKNAGQVERRITFNATNAVVVPAMGAAQLSFNFDKGTGTYGYRCSGTSGTVGIVQIVNP